jgi:GNAT superfamily N-acetyltransferase
MNITYHHDRNISSEQFIDVLNRSSLGVRRPVSDAECIAGMLKHADLLCTAWDGDKLVGVSRSVTDFSYCCYLSDLAVDADYQKHGIGKQLIRQTQMRLGPLCKIILLAAPAATDYYPKIGFTAHHSAWLLAKDQPLQ